MPKYYLLLCEKRLTSVDVDKVRLLLHNVDQIRAVMAATFGSDLFNNETLKSRCTASDADALACESVDMISKSGRAVAHGEVDLSVHIISKVWLHTSSCGSHTKFCSVATKGAKRPEWYGKQLRHV